MEERERGAGRPASNDRDAVAANPIEVGQAAVRPDISGSDEHADQARFFEALDEVMSDHHNVLAALAK